MRSDCISNGYLDFLLYLVTFEMNNLKIYDLFKSIHAGDIQLNTCYSKLAHKYLALESVIGDPTLALYKLGEVVYDSKLSRFLKEYSNTVTTTGDTLTYTNNALREELSASRAKIAESLRLLEILYEVVLVSALGISLLIMVPISNLTPLVSLFILWLIGILSYIISHRIMSMLHLDTAQWLIMYDLFLISVAYLLVNIRHGYLIYTLMVLISSILIGPLARSRWRADKEVLRIFNDVYSYTMLGEPADTALMRSLENTTIDDIRSIRFLLVNGFDVSKIINRLDLSSLTRKVLVFLTSTLQYSGQSNKYLASLRTILDEITSTRRFVNEKARFFLVYSIVLIVLITSSVIMIKRIPILYLNADLVSTLVFLIMLDMIIPISVITDGGFCYSKTSLIMLLVASMVSLILAHLGF